MTVDHHPNEQPQSHSKALSSIKRSLHVAGLLFDREGARLALPVLTELAPRLEALRSLLPNLGNTIDALTSACHLTVRGADHTKLLKRESKVSFNGAAGFSAWLIEQLTHKSPPVHDPAWLDVMAVRWLHSSAIRSFGDQLGTLERVNAPDRDYARLPAQPLQVDSNALNIGYVQWLRLVSEQAPSCGIPALVESLRRIIEIPFHTPPPRTPMPPPRLNERQLLTTHWLHIRPEKHRELIELLKYELRAPGITSSTRQDQPLTNLEDPSSQTAGDEPQRGGHYYEAILLLLSIQTSHSIQALLQWSVHPPTTHASRTDIQDGNSFQHFPARSKTFGTIYAKAQWVKKLGGTTAIVELPFEVRSWLSNLHPGIGAPSLGSLLPFSRKAWDARAYEFLADKLGCSTSRAELITRDLVPRLLYEKTSNSALVNFWRADSGLAKDRAERLALGHYLKPEGARASNSLAKACSDALGRDIYKPDAHSVYLRRKSEPIDWVTIQTIVQSLEKEYASASEPIARHNSLARLVLFILLIATGHRRSVSPFPFPWDFSLPDQLIFICDKLITGSEARFVPLPGVALAYLQRYATGLRRISRLVQGEARSYAEQTASFLSFDTAPPKSSRRTNFHPSSGVFFLLEQDGTLSRKRLTTGALDLHIELLTNVRQPTAKLRSLMAQQLWEKGCSGRVVQAFLGHQPEMHVHGATSTWSVLDVAEHITPVVQQVLVEWLQCRETIEGKHYPSPDFPSLDDTTSQGLSPKPALGYEGRKREKAWLEYRAQAVLRQEISGRLLASEIGPTVAEELLTNDDQKRISERLAMELSHDPVAMKGVSAQLEARLSKSGQPIRAMASDWASATPGPVEIGFSRLLRSAHVFRSIWERSVGLPIGNPEFDTVEALAHLAISLVCFDAVLAKENLESLVRAAANGIFETYQGKITLRASVVTATHDFEFSVRPGAVSSALVLGIAKRSEDSAFDWSEVERRIQAILHKLLCLGSPQKWSVARLCLVFRPYWLIRLPGAMYSVSIGEYKGPAADASSEAMLHGKRPPPPPAKPLSLGEPTRAVEHDQQEALKGLKLLFRNARGALEKGEQRRRVQRAKLRSSVRAELNEDMLRWSSSSQIVHLLLTFIDWLLDNGGHREKSLAFRSIEKYFSLVAEFLIREAWSIDFESCDADALEHLFDSVAQQIDQDQGRTVLKYFAAHLQDSMGTPYFGARWSNPRSPVRIRTSLVLPQHIDRALTLLAKRADPLSRQASTLIATCAGYGLRRLEAFGLAAHQFDAHQSLHLSVTRTLVGDLKTKWSRRVIASPLLAGPPAERLTQEIQLARTSPREVQYLFEADTRDYRINSVSKISALATTALRVATGNSAIVPHHLRHSFGTILGIAVLAGPKSDGSLSRLATRLLGAGYARVASSVLNHPNDWPFGVDAIANVLGHADVGMFLNTYFHASHWVISDRCAQWQPRQVQQVRLGNIFDVDRTTLSKLQTRLKASCSKDEIALDEMVKEIARRHEDPTTYQQVHPDQSRAQYSDQWSHVFRALLYRLDNDLTLAEMWSYASAHLSISPERIQEISRRYTHFVRETGFDDFEPASSDLIDAVASHRSGVVRGRLKRESFTAAVQQWANAAPENRSALEELLSIWVDRVDPIAPRIVCQNMDELQRTITTLESLGATAAHLSFELHGDQLDPWLVKAQKVISLDSHATVRASRGSARVKVPEVSIAVKQVPGSPVPDGRDFHRALVGVYLSMSRAMLNKPL